MALSLGACGNSEPTSSEIEKPKNVDVIIISGQSNAVGCTHTNCISRSIGYEKYQEYLAGYKGIQIAYDCWTKDTGPIFYSQNTSKDNTFTKVMLGQGNSLATFGPEIGIAEQLHEQYDGKLFLIKFACGASCLGSDWTGRDSEMYGRFISYVKLQMKNLEDMGYIPTIKAFCFMQGEGDAWADWYEAYKTNLSKFVGDVREDLKSLSGNKDVPFIDAGISSATQWQYYKEVNEAKQAFANESDNNFYIDTIKEGLHTDQEPFGDPDTAHYDSESEVKLGHLFAETFEQFLAK